MKCFKRIILVVAAFASVLSVCTNGTTKEVLADNLLNTDKSLGIFRDLSQDEIKDYYGSLSNGLKGDDLLAKLQPILKKNQVKLNYSSGNTTTTSWNGYYLLDREWEKSPLTNNEIKNQKYQTSNIWMDILYSSYSIKIGTRINNGTFEWEENGKTKTVSYKNGSAQFDREHVFPKSFGFNGANDRYKDLTAGCDMQNLHAGEHIGNVSHSNFPYGDVVKSKEEVKSGITGEVVGYLGYNEDNIWVFEPLAEDKGDIARTIFYMCARYHTYDELGNNDNTPALTLTKTPNRIATTDPEDTKNNPAAYGDLDELLSWNKQDPVSYQEIHRNNLCYNAVQYNRNPFIDYPAWADVAFGNSSQGIDLSKNDGVSSGSQVTPPTTSLPITSTPTTSNDLTTEAPNIPSLCVSTNITSIFKEETIDITKIEFNFDGKNIPLSSISVAITTPSSRSVSNVNLEEYLFNEVGTYIIKFSYYDQESGLSYENQLSISVKPTYSIIIDTSNINLKVEAFKSFNFDGLVVKRASSEGNTTLSSNDYVVEIYDSSNNLIKFSGEYKINKPGTYSVKVTHNYDGEVLEDSFEIIVGVPKVIIFIAVAVVILIVIILFVSVNKNSKKKKNKKKTTTKKKSAQSNTNKKR